MVGLALRKSHAIADSAHKKENKYLEYKKIRSAALFAKKNGIFGRYEKITTGVLVRSNLSTLSGN